MSVGGNPRLEMLHALICGNARIYSRGRLESHVVMSHIIVVDGAFRFESLEDFGRWSVFSDNPWPH
jgi:hypothetical protein